MKKVRLTVMLLMAMFIAVLVSSCNNHTCPAYAQKVEAEQKADS